MGHDECPMAVTLKTGYAARGAEAIAERPDGTRCPFLAYPTPLRNDNGQLLGAVNMLVDITERKRNEEAAQHYAAIVESSDDAILSKDINGVITSWNSGAQRLFGYTSQEAVGKPVTMLIPADRHDEEPRILERIRRGERIDHYETVRQRKDGSFVDISLTVSPIRDLRGNIIGASKIARDITERKRAEERQDLLLREMDHRIKNLFALAIGIVSLSGRSAKNVQDLVRSARERLSALARAHALTLSHGPRDDPQGTKPTTLHSLIRTIIAPHENMEDAQGGQITIAGPDLAISGSAISSLALLLHEFGTNSAKYGALSAPKGQDRDRRRRTRPNTRPHMDGTRRTRDHLPARLRRVWRHSHSRDGHGPTRWGDLPRLEARRTRHPAIPTPRAFDGMKWAKRPPARCQGSEPCSLELRSWTTPRDPIATK